MKKQLLATAALVLLGAGSALADHNSMWGEGTALDPRGIHDDRIDTLASGDDFTGGQDASGPMDLTAFARGGAPDTIEAGNDIETGGMGGSGSAGGSESAGGNGGGGNGGGGNGGGGNGGGGNGGR